jgi:hypothetical protein
LNSPDRKGDLKEKVSGTAMLLSDMPKKKTPPLQYRLIEGAAI